MAKDTVRNARLEIPFFDGVNTLVGHNLAKRQELQRAENARSKIIGTIEKREGTRRLGSSITATANYGLMFFENDASTNTGFYRISTVSSATSIYYLNSSAVWTALTGFGTGIFELGDSTTQFDITNPGGSTYRYTYDTNGTDPDIDHHIAIGSTVVVNAQNFSSGNNGTFTVTGVGAAYFEVTNASGVAENNKTIGTGSITVTGNVFDHTIANGALFLVNGNNDNMYIASSDGTTITTSTTATGHLYNSPKARKINYYKERLYVGDYKDSGGTRYKNGIMRSSVPLGIAALVDGDHDAGVTTVNVTETKYIHASDTLIVYRGGTQIQTLTVTAKGETSITINAAASALNSADELWVNGSFTGNRIFRWANNPSSGIPTKQYDTFALTGEQNDRIRMMTNIGGVMVIANANNMAIWDDYSLKQLDIGVGCVSDYGYTKALGTLFFVHYTGIYGSTGGRPRLMSSPVQRYFDGATRAGLEAACMGRKGLSVFAHIGDVTLYHDDGSVESTLTDVVLEYNLRQENWYVHTGIKATAFATYQKTDDADRLEFTSTETGYHVYEFLTGQLDDAVTSDKEIPFRIDSNRIQLASEFETICNPLEVIVESERGSGMKVFVSLDGGPWYELKGQIVKGCTILKVHNRNPEMVTPPKCRFMRLSIRDNTKKLCRISRVAVNYIETKATENNDPYDNG